MSGHPSHHSGPPRLSDGGSIGYPGPSSYQHPPPPPPLQDHQHQHTHQQHQQPPPPPPALLNSPVHSNHHYSSYPSHNSQSIGTHHGPGNPGIGVSDLYRPSSIGPPPPAPASANNAIPSLPSMRTMDALPPPTPSNSSMHSSPYPGAPPTLPPGPLPYFSMPPPYGIQPQSLPSFSSYGHHHGHMNDMRMPSFSIGGPRLKKEIKRRTKTGCMTCRKRRIKCDETHPTCNNCKKSKRDCAGYDPIFKQQPNNPGFLQETAHVSPHNGSATAASSTAAPTSAGRPSSPPPAPSPLASLKSPSILGGPSSHSSAPSSSGSTASNYYSTTGPSPASSSSSYPSNTNGNSNGSSGCNGSGAYHNGTDGTNSYSSHNNGTSSYSSRPILSPHEYSGTSYDPVGSAFKDEPRRDYWADRAPRPAYTTTSDVRDLGQYGQDLL